MSFILAGLRVICLTYRANRRLVWGAPLYLKFLYYSCTSNTGQPVWESRIFVILIPAEMDGMRGNHRSFTSIDVSHTNRLSHQLSLTPTVSHNSHFGRYDNHLSVIPAKWTASLRGITISTHFYITVVPLILASRYENHLSLIPTKWTAYVICYTFFLVKLSTIVKGKFAWWIQKLAKELSGQSWDGADVQVHAQLQNRANLKAKCCCWFICCCCCCCWGWCRYCWCWGSCCCSCCFQWCCCLKLLLLPSWMVYLLLLL